MGDVYRATHRLLARPAAIKLIRPEALGAEGPDRAQVVVERFRREARAAASLKCPHTIELYDFGTADDGTFYYVMELLNGLDLRELVGRFGPLGAPRTVHLLKQVCLSLAEAHDRGLIHRDIKPSNLVACRMGVAVDYMKVLDFGLVKSASDTETPARDLTSPDVTTGTPAYMAPEIAVGNRPVDHRADLYALGCVAFWMLTGRDVFEGATPIAVLTQHVRDEAPAPSSLSETTIPVELDRIVHDCLAKDPAERPASALELLARLNAVPVESWSAEAAREWWELHLPERMTPGWETAPVERIASEETRSIRPDSVLIHSHPEHSMVKS
jgi:serine/threonine-protein kinase